MYNPLPTGEPEGVLNDYDLASWTDHPTANSDRTGTIPFMSLNMLDRGLENRIPRLYRHDAESLIWVLAYITIVNVKYKGHTFKISRPCLVEPWFEGDRRNHILSKFAFPPVYGRIIAVTEPHKRYIKTIKSLVNYWVQFEPDSYELGSAGPTKPEADDPRGALENLVKGVEGTLSADDQREFAKVRTLLLEAIGAPEVV